MKVLYFSEGFGPHDERFLTALAKTEHDVLFLRMKDSGTIELPPGIHEVHFPNAVRKFNKLHDAAQEFHYLVKMLQPDVVHAGPLHGPAYIAALAGFTPLVSMSWGADLLFHAEHSLLTRMKCKFTLQHSTVFVGDCQAVADKAAGMGFSKERIFLFPWGVDLQHFQPAGNAPLREQLGWQNNFIFLSNRSFEKIYGVDVVMRGFIEAAKKNPDIRLLVLGKGSQEPYIRRLAADAGVTDKVHFGDYAPRAELPAIYRSADVFLSASHCDGSSVSLMETLACGRPALVSNIAGNLEWVTEGQNGWIFKDNDSHGLAKKILAAAQSTNLIEMGMSARRTAEQKADWSRNFLVLLRAYQAAVELRLTTKEKTELT